MVIALGVTPLNSVSGKKTKKNDKTRPGLTLISLYPPFLKNSKILTQLFDDDSNVKHKIWLSSELTRNVSTANKWEILPFGIFRSMATISQDTENTRH